MTDPLIFRIHVTPPVARARPASVRIPVETNGLSTVLVAATEGPRGPQGLPGTGVPIVGEEPVGAKNGSNTVFTLAHSYRTATIAVYTNGLREIPGLGFTETSPTTITLGFAPTAQDVITVDYIVA